MELQNPQKVLVLGSRGQIGISLCQKLKDAGHKVVELDLVIDPAHDLRLIASPEINEAFQCADFAFFLAYDVGGSRYLQKYQESLDFVLNNTKIMTNVFELLKNYSIPFIFASSQMSNMSFSAYGALKSVGEHFTKALGGLVVKFWNVYGFEPDKTKAHVITDFVDSALNTRQIVMLTDGKETREFLYVDDCSNALLLLMEKSSNSTEFQSFDITSFQRSTILEVANEVATQTGAIVIPGTRQDTVQKNQENTPDQKILQFWKPQIDLRTGISKIIEKSRASVDK
jgi:nucleoside-diphosphate-sugar epimerase